MARWANLLGRDKKSCRSKTTKHAAGVALLVAAILGLQFSGAMAADSWSTSDSGAVANRPAKLQWRPIRPQRADASAPQNAHDAPVNNAHYESDMFDDSSPAPPVIRLVVGGEKPAANSTNQDEFLNSALNDPFFEAVPAKKAQRQMPLQSDASQAAPPTSREEPPPLRVIADPAQRVPPELTPSDPLRSASAPRSFTSQIDAGSPTVPSPPDLLPNNLQSQPPAPHKPEDDCREDYNKLKA
ncbi:MAG TPA: hypothetical protein VGJ15_01100, partial [Pirellulales bacterium]